MNELTNFKKYMKKVGAEYMPGKPGECSQFHLGNCLYIQLNHQEKDCEDFISVHVCLRKVGYYFPLGEAFDTLSLRLIEKIEKILIRYDINNGLVIKACW